MISVKDLDVYKTGFDIAIAIYKTTEAFPKTEIFGLASQMRRAAVSINSNISEGSSRNTTGEYKHFVGIANGSASELEFQIELSRKLGFINENDYTNLIEQITRERQMLSKLLKSLSNHEPRTTNHGTNT
jgi:four helix bundle protein